MRYFNSFFNESLNESFSSQKDLTKISNTIYDCITKHFISNYKAKSSKDAISVVRERLNKSVNCVINKSSIKDSIIKDLINNKGKFINLDIILEEKRSSTRGTFVIQSSLMNDIFKLKIYLQKYEIEDISQIYLDSTLSDEHDKINDIHRLLKDVKSVILHELQHWYDEVRSNGKYKDTKNEYINQRHEIDARFTQAISELKIVDSMDFVDGKIKFKFITFDEYKREFIKQFMGFDKLSSKDKKRVLRKLGQFYELSKEEKNNIQK